MTREPAPRGSMPIRCNWWMSPPAGASGWSERVALPNRGQAAMEAALRTAFARLPFALVELHPDNGREFFNWHLKRLYPALVPGLALSRSRPYHKNDNRFVEQ